MSTDLGEKNEPPPARRRWQFSLRRMFVATTAVAILFSLASWGGWVKSDAVVYLSVALLAAVFSAAARRVILGACVIVGAFLIALILGGTVFDFGRDSWNPVVVWILATFLATSAAFTRMYEGVNTWSLIAAMMLTEVNVTIARALKGPDGTAQGNALGTG